MDQRGPTPPVLFVADQPAVGKLLSRELSQGGGGQDCFKWAGGLRVDVGRRKPSDLLLDAPPYFHRFSSAEPIPYVPWADKPVRAPPEPKVPYLVKGLFSIFPSSTLRPIWGAERANTALESQEAGSKRLGAHREPSRQIVGPDRTDH